MASTTLRPSSTISNSGVTVTGASAHAATNDNSDASYLSAFASGDSVEFNLDNITLPAGAITKDVRVRLRSSSGGGPAKTIAVTLVDGADAVARDDNVVISWGTLLEHQATVEAIALSDADVDGLTLRLAGTTTSPGIVVAEASVVVTYVAIPVVTVTTPTGTVTTTNTPFVDWANALDADGGDQTHYEVKVFTAAVYGGGGFNPDSSAPIATSGVTAYFDTGWEDPTTLPDGDYRAYVRVAQTVNGARHWSAWDWEGFTIDVDLPAVPTLTVTPDSANGRHELTVSGNTGTATTTGMEIERSEDGGTTWEPLRITAAELAAWQLYVGVDPPSTGAIVGVGSSVVYDYEAPNGTAMQYRARAVHNYSGEFAASAWATATGTWSSDDEWLKCPEQPSLNAVVRVDSLPGYQRPARHGIFQALGRADPIVVSDTRLAARGGLRLDIDTAAKQDQVDALLDVGLTLLLQLPPARHWTDRYMRLGDQERERWIDKGFVEPVQDTLQWWQVAKPTGVVDAWPA